MPQQLKEIMTTAVESVRCGTSVREAARLMCESDIGDVLITDVDGSLFGILTDRDIVVRAIATNCDVDSTKVDEICSCNPLWQLGPEASVDEAIELMRDHALRRIPVVSDGKPVGIITIGDLAKKRDPRSALADISAAPPNN